MDPGAVRLEDLHRILIGDAPWLFLLEAVGRTVLLYLALLLFMRLMGKRIASQLSASEFAVFLTLGAAVGLPMQAADTGLLAAVVVLAVALAVQRGIAYVSMRSRRAETLTQGAVTILVEEGHLLPDALDGASLSRDTFIALLRAQGVVQLGELRRAYLEPSGQLSLIRYRQPRPGLPLLPGPFEAMPDLARADGRCVCAHCGAARPADDASCATCGHHTRTAAFTHR